MLQERGRRPLWVEEREEGGWWPDGTLILRPWSEELWPSVYFLHVVCILRTKVTLRLMRMFPISYDKLPWLHIDSLLHGPAWWSEASFLPRSREVTMGPTDVLKILHSFSSPSSGLSPAPAGLLKQPRQGKKGGIGDSYSWFFFFFLLQFARDRKMEKCASDYDPSVLPKSFFLNF